MTNLITVKFGTKYGPEFVNKIYNDIREFSLSDNVKCLDVIRDKITELFNEKNMFKTWMQNTFKQDDSSVEAGDINCLIERKSYLYLFFHVHF